MVNQGHHQTPRPSGGETPSGDPTLLLIDAVRRLSRTRTVDEIKEIVRTTARQLCGADGATFVLRDGGFCFYADEDASGPLWKGQRFPLESCVSGRAMRNREPVVIPDIYVDPRVPHDAYRPTFVQSLALVPIRQDDPIGAIGNYWSEKRRADPREIALLQALAEATGVAMDAVQRRVDTERELAERAADRDAVLALSADLIRTLSHELRNALGGSRGLLEAVLADPTVRLDPEVREDLRVVGQGIHDGLQLAEAQLADATARAAEFTARDTEA